MRLLGYLFISFLLLASLALAFPINETTYRPFDTKTQNGLTVSKYAISQVEHNGTYTACFYVNQSVKFFANPALTKNEINFAKSLNITNVKTRLVTTSNNGTAVTILNATNSTEVIYCFDYQAIKDSQNRTILPTSNPFNLSFASKLADPDPGCMATLSSASTYYTMTADCTAVGFGTDAYDISASDITLDCAGYNIISDGSSSQYGVAPYGGGNNPTIKNCIIRGLFAVGISATATSGLTATNNSIRNTTSSAISSSMSGLSITDNVINISQNRALYITASSGTILHNVIQGDRWAYVSNANVNMNNSNSGNHYIFHNGTESGVVYNLTCTNTCPWADGGSARPYNSTTATPQFESNAVDNFPYVGGGGATTAVTVNSIALTPSNPQVATKIGCAVNVSSNVAAAPNVTIDWFKNGVNVSAAEVKNTSYTNNSIWNLTTTPNDLGAAALDNISCAVLGNDSGTYSSFNYSSNITVVSADTCTHPAKNAAWEINCADNCVIGAVGTITNIDRGSGHTSVYGNGIINFVSVNFNATHYLMRKIADTGTACLIVWQSYSNLTMK